MAFSGGDAVSTCAGAVVRADRVVDGLAYGRCTVGGDDATDAVCALIDRIDRPDVPSLLLAGIAPAWFNLLDPARIYDETGLPTLSISFEASPGLAPAIREQFDGDAREWRLDAYDSLPPRRWLSVNGDRLFVRAVGIEASVADSAGSVDPADSTDRIDSGTDAEQGVPPLAPNCEAAQLVRAFTPEGSRPEPLRVARMAARAGRELSDERPE